MNTIAEILVYLQQEHARLGITLYAPAGAPDLNRFEQRRGIRLPDELRMFYGCCNGFESEEDMFRMVPLQEIDEREEIPGPAFNFAEYMIYCDYWTIAISNEDPSCYSIYNEADKIVTLTYSFADFLKIFLQGGVFDGLYSRRAVLSGEGPAGYPCFTYAPAQWARRNAAAARQLKAGSRQ